MTEDRAEAGEYSGPVVLQLGPGDSDDDPAVGCENLVAKAVGLEGLVAAVELVAVDLDADLLGEERDVEEVASDGMVGAPTLEP